MFIEKVLTLLPELKTIQIMNEELSDIHAARSTQLKQGDRDSTKHTLM